MRWTRCALGLWCVVEFSGSPLAARDGFGWIRGKEVPLMVVRPPRIALGARRLEVRVASAEAVDSGIARRLTAELGSELSRRGCAVTTNPSLAGAVLDLEVLAHARSDRWQRPSGVAAVIAQLGGSGWSSLSPSQESVRETLRVAYRILVGELSLDADTLEVATGVTVQQGDSPPTAAETESKVVASVVSAVAARLTVSHERVAVLVPRGPLDRFARLAETGQWRLYRTALESVRATDVRSESYRQY